jgi:hypothetical protein
MLDTQAHVTHEPLHDLPTKQPTRIVTYAWGENYVHELLSFTVPALLAPGNLPSIAASVPCELVILTEERFFATVGCHASILRAKEFCPLRLIALDDLITQKDKYGMALTHALHRAFSDLGPAMTASWQIFLNADFILADGSLRNLLRHLARGEHLVAAPSYCVAAAEVAPELSQRVDQKTSSLSISPRELAALAIKHRHNTIRGKTVNERQFNIRYMDQFYWLVDKSTLLGHQMPIAIVGMRPERYLAEVNSYWDYGLMREFCPKAEACVLGDSDEFLMIELRETKVAEDQIASTWPEPKQIAERMMVFATEYQREFARYPLTLHTSNLTSEVDKARAKLRTYVDEILSYLPDFLPSHLDHPQWNYHLPAFFEARHKFLSARLGSLTETVEPPGFLSKADRVWWQLDGIRKTFSRKRAELEQTMTQLPALIKRETDDIDNEITKQRDAIDQEFIQEFATIQNKLNRSEIDDVVSKFLVAGSSASSNSSEPLAALVERYEDRLCQILGPIQKRRNELDECRKRIIALYDQRIHHLESDHKRKCQELENAYQELLQRRVISAATPYVSVHQGPATVAPLTSGTIWRLITKLYQTIFGKVPRVTQLSCYWAPLRHLVRLVDAAVAGGAKNVLIIGSPHVSVIGTIADDLPGRHGLVSMSGLRTGNLAKAVDRWPKWDLCICNLELADLAEASAIVTAIRPVMSNGSTIIGFYLNYQCYDSLPLPMDRASIDSIFRLKDTTRVYFAGSIGSSRVIRKFRDAVNSYRTNSHYVVSAAMLVLRLLKITPQAVVANRREAAIAPKGFSVPREVCTSVTIEVVVDAIG